MDVQFKYQTLYTCSVPEHVTVIRDFSEKIQTDYEPTAESILETIRLSFEQAEIMIESIQLSPDNRTCYVKIEGEPSMLKVTIRWRPSLVIGNNAYRLEEFDW